MPRRASGVGRGNRAPRTPAQLASLAKVNLRPRTPAQRAALMLGRRKGRSRRVPQSERGRLTPRQVEVFSREVVPWSLVALVRETPRGLCVVCGRPLGPKARFACSRVKPGTVYRECYFFFRSLRVKVAGLLSQEDVSP